VDFLLSGIINKKSSSCHCGVVLVIGILLFVIYLEFGASDFEFTGQNKPLKL